MLVQPVHGCGPVSPIRHVESLLLVEEYAGFASKPGAGSGLDLLGYNLKAPVELRTI